MANPKLEALARRIQDLEDQIQGLQQHGWQHQLGGNDEILVTQALRIMGDPATGATVTAGHLKLLNRGVPLKEGWIKLNETGDVYINPPLGQWMVFRFDNANRKVKIDHDGTNAHLTAENAGALILQGGVASYVDLGLDDANEVRMRRHQVALPSLWTAAYNVAATSTSSTLNTWTSITGVTGTVVTKGGNLWCFVTGGAYRQTNGGAFFVRIMLDHATLTDYYIPNSTGWRLNAGIASNEHTYFAFAVKVTGVAAGTYTARAQVHDNNSALVTSDGNDPWTLMIGED